MGWSCESEAGRMMDKLFELTSSDGLIHYEGKTYLCEVENKEYEDGRILITVYSVRKNGYRYTGKRLGYFYIMPGGKISEDAKRKFPFLNLLS